MSLQLKLLMAWLVRPWRAPSETLDGGRIAFAAVFALVAALLLQAPSAGSGARLEQLTREGVELARASQAAPLTPEQERRMMEVREEVARIVNAGRAGGSPGPLRVLLLVVIVMAPVGIAVAAAWEGLGRTGLLVEQNWAGMACCLLFAYAATQLPAAVLQRVAPLPLGWAFQAWFVGLAALSIRTALGTRAVPAAAAAVAGGGAAWAAAWMTMGLGGLYWFASPWVLYLLWRNFGGQVGDLGAGFGRQQAFRRHLEALTVNPRDADAHYQLGLLYAQRHDLAQAEERFRQAVAIDEEDADYLFQLGRTLAGLGRPGEAIPLLERAAKIDRRVSSYEAWRELGAALLATGEAGKAVEALATFCGNREYDPQGQVLFGKALVAAGRAGEARAAFEKAIEAVNTMPAYRRRETRRWADAAREELGGLG